MVRNWILYIVLLVFGVFLYVFTNTAWTFLVLIVMVLLPVISYVLMALSGRAVQVRVDLPVMLTKDEAVFICNIDNGGRIPVVRLSFSLELENHLTGSSSSRAVVASVGGRRSCEVRFAMEQPYAGTVSVSAVHVRIYDCFGLFSLRKSDPPASVTTVWPRSERVDVLMNRPVETAGDGVRYSPDRKGADVSEMLSMRPYEEGDEIRRIHWKASGKFDDLIVRDFSLPLNYNVFLLAEFVQCDADALDTMMEIFLGVSASLLEQGVNHNLAWFDAGGGDLFVRQLDDLEDFEAASAEVLSVYTGEGIAPALEQYLVSGYRTGKAIVIYITADPQVEMIAEAVLSQNVKVICIGQDTPSEDMMGGAEVFAVAPGQTGGMLPAVVV